MGANLFGEIYRTEDRGALRSPCGRYRWRLWRRWASSVHHVLFVMLNPSTADGTQDDATLRSCRRLATSWGYGALEVVNLFAWRATDPRNIPAGLAEARGPERDAHILAAAEGAGVVVAAWGAASAAPLTVRRALDGEAARIQELLKRPFSHLGLTKSGQPQHPLYLPTGVKFATWEQGGDRG
jgi:hypothetical protein